MLNNVFKQYHYLSPEIIKHNKKHKKLKHMALEIQVLRHTKLLSLHSWKKVEQKYVYTLAIQLVCRFQI